LNKICFASAYLCDHLREIFVQASMFPAELRRLSQKELGKICFASAHLCDHLREIFVEASMFPSELRRLSQKEYY